LLFFSRLTWAAAAAPPPPPPSLQVVQLFDSWAHHLSPEQFQEFSLPYANQVIEGVRALHPDVPLIFHANGGAARAGQGPGWWPAAWDARAGACCGCGQSPADCASRRRALGRAGGPHSGVPRPAAVQEWGCHVIDMALVLARAAAGTGKMGAMQGSNADVIGLDWSTDMATARRELGADRKVQGNVDPMILFGTQDAIEAEVKKVLLQVSCGRAGGGGVEPVRSTWDALACALPCAVRRPGVACTCRPWGALCGGREGGALVRLVPGLLNRTHARVAAVGGRGCALRGRACLQWEAWRGV